MGPNPNAFCCGFPSGLAQITVQVATSNPLSRYHPCRDIDLKSRHLLKSMQLFNWMLMMSRHQSLVATSAHVFCMLQMVVPDVATSISCRDINLMNCSFQLISSDVATSIPCRDITSCLCRFHWLFLLSRHQPLVSAQSSAAYLVISVTTCIKFHSIFLMSRPHNLDCANPKTATLINQLLPFLPCHLNCTFTPPIAAFSYCFFFFLPLSLLITNW